MEGQGLNFAGVLDHPAAEGEVVNATYEEAPEIVTVTPIMSLEAVKPRFMQYVAQVDRMVADAQAVEVTDSDREKFAVALGGQAKKIAKALEAQEKEVTQDARDFVAAIRGIVDGFTDKLVANTKRSNTDCIELVLKKKIGDYQYSIELKRREQEAAAKKAAQELQDRLNREAEEANRKAREEAMRLAQAEAEKKRLADEEEARKRGAKKAEMEVLAKKAEEERVAALQKAEEEAKSREIVAPIVPDIVIPAHEQVVRTETGATSYQQKRWTFEIIDPDLVPRGACSPDPAKIRDMVKSGVRQLPGVRIYEVTDTKFRT